MSISDQYSLVSTSYSWKTTCHRYIWIFATSLWLCHKGAFYAIWLPSYFPMWTFIFHIQPPWTMKFFWWKGHNIFSDFYWSNLLLARNSKCKGKKLCCLDLICFWWFSCGGETIATSDVKCQMAVNFFTSLQRCLFTTHDDKISFESYLKKKVKEI